MAYQSHTAHSHEPTKAQRNDDEQQVASTPQGPNQQANDERCGNGDGPNAVCLYLRGIVYGYHGCSRSGEMHTRHARLDASRHTVNLLNEQRIAVGFARSVWRSEHGHSVAVVGRKDIAIVQFVTQGVATGLKSTKQGRKKTQGVAFDVLRNHPTRGE